MCEFIRKCKSTPACAHWHFYNPFDGVCISLRVFFVLACPHVHTFAPACNTGLLACVPCVCVCVCVRVCVCVCVPGEPVAGQRISPDQGHIRGGDADDRQPLRFCLPPLLLSSTHL